MNEYYTTSLPSDSEGCQKIEKQKFYGKFEIGIALFENYAI